MSTSTLTWFPRGRLSIPKSARGPLAGVVIGYLILSLWSEFATRWAMYVSLGAIAGLALPFVAKLFGGLEPLFAYAFLFSLQFFLSFNLIHEDKTMAGGVQGINVSITLVMAVAYTAVWIYRRALGHEGPWRVNRRFVFICAVFVGVSALSIINTTTLSYTVFGITYNVALAFIALLTCHLCSTREGVNRLWRAFVAILVFQSLVLLAQRAFHVSIDMSGEFVDSKWGERYGGTMGVAPVNAATLLMVLLFFVEVKLLTTRGSKSLLGWGAAFGIAAVCLLLSLTRSCWVGFAIGSVYILGRLSWRRQINAARVAILGMGLIVSLAVAWGPVRERVDDNHENAAEERWKLNFVNLEMMKAHPVIGIGLNTAYDSKMQYVPEWFTEYDWVYIAHNQFLLIGAETGILGLLTFIWLHLASLDNARRAAQARERQLAYAGTAMTAAMIALTWGMHLDFYSGMQAYTFLWMLYGTAAGLCTLREREAAEIPAERALDAA